MTIGINKIDTPFTHSRKPLIQHFEEHGTYITLKLATSLVEMEENTPVKTFLAYLEEQINTFTKRVEWAESEQDTERYQAILDVYTRYKNIICAKQKAEV